MQQKKIKRWYDVGQEVEMGSWKDVLNGEAWKKGKEEFREGKVKPLRSIKGVWAKKLVTTREFNGHYKYHSSYCKLGDVDFLGKKRIKIAFLVAGVLPFECEELTREELKELDKYRRGHNILPTPFGAEGQSVTI